MMLNPGKLSSESREVAIESNVLEYLIILQIKYNPAMSEVNPLFMKLINY